MKKKTNPFILFGRAFKNAKKDFWVSIFVLFVVTIVLSIVFFFVEHKAQPEQYANPWDAFVWSVTRYIGDPGHFAGNGPITLAGRYIDTIIGIMKILIFAVPAGLVANGFRKAMEDDKKERMFIKNADALSASFRRIGQNDSWYVKGSNRLKYTYKYVPRFYSVAYLQVKASLTADDIINTVNYCPNMRLSNLSSTQRAEEHPNDRIVVSCFPLNTEYGCFINRDSNVTIISPSTSLGAGNFAFSLAAMGGFNFISKEISFDRNEPISYYVMDEEDITNIPNYDKKEAEESQALHFMDDLKSLKEGKQHHWFFFILPTKKSKDCQMHFWRLATDTKKLLPYRIIRKDPVLNEEREFGSTVLKEDENILQNIFAEASHSLEKRDIMINDQKQVVKIDIDNPTLLKGVTKSNLMRRVGGGVDSNAVTIRVAYDILAYDSKHLLKAKDLADAIKNNIEKDREIPAEAKALFLKTGNGFSADSVQGESGEKGVVFEQNPKELSRQLADWRKKALDKYEYLTIAAEGLDGIRQKDFPKTKWYQFNKRKKYNKLKSQTNEL